MILQTTADLRGVLSTNDATITGILIAVILALGYVVIHLYNNSQVMHKEYIAELRASNALLIKVTEDYNKSITGLMDLFKKQ